MNQKSKSQAQVTVYLLLIIALLITVGWQCYDLYMKTKRRSQPKHATSLPKYADYTPRYGDLKVIPYNRSLPTVLSKLASTTTLNASYHHTNQQNILPRTSIAPVKRQDPPLKPNSLERVKVSSALSKKIPPLCLNEAYDLCTPIPNIFIREVYNTFKNRSYEDVVGFNGQSVKHDFDPQGLLYGVSLGGRTARIWREVAHLINQSYILQAKHHPPKAIHLHNELKFGDLLELVIKEHRLRKRTPLQSESDFHQVFDLNQPPIVITNTADENWGFLSTPINTRTTKWINMTNHLLIHGASYPMVQHFLSSPKVRP
jgi:hypothetical protein